MSYTYDDRIFSDLWKEAYGYRPSADVQASWNTSTPSQKQLCWDLLADEVDRKYEEEEAAKDAALAEFENTISNLRRSGAGSCNTAMRWYVESLIADGDISHQDLEFYGSGFVCYTLGLPYEIGHKLNPICKTIAQRS